MNPPTRTSQSRPLVTWLLILVVILLVVLPLAFVKNGTFAGSDSAGSELIAQLRPGFQPWFHSVWTPPGSEIESMLFALQAALGAGVIGYVFGLKRGAQQARAAAIRDAAQSRAATAGPSQP